jgi:hypothetical protein
VTDRKKWKDLARQAKAHSGLQCQWKKKKKKSAKQMIDAVIVIVCSHHSKAQYISCYLSIYDVF